MKISALMKAPSVKILLFILEHDEVRYTDLTKLIASRGTLSVNIKELEEEGLLKRRIVTTKPIQAFYSLSPVGLEMSNLLKKVQKLIC